MAGQVAELILRLGTYEKAVDARLNSWQTEQLGRRIWEKDHTVWAADPIPELTDRLGWLALPSRTLAEADAMEALAREVMQAGFHQVVVLGMGGSSLAPEVFGAVFGSAPDYPRLVVLDTTHPDAVRNVERTIDPATTLFLVSSKSGTTLETLSLFRTCWDQVAAVTQDPGKHFVAITDAGSPLEGLAERRRFRRVFNAPSDVGGRYSALSAFGLAPAALIGADVRHMLANAAIMAETCSGSVDPVVNPGLILGAVLGELALAGVDKITFVTSPDLAPFPAWIEQLVAESTGKNGKGILPVDSEPGLPYASYSPDRFFVLMGLRGATDDLPLDPDELERAGHPVAQIRLADKTDLGQEMFRWEIAVAAAGAVLGINPFDQPDVQLAKDLARRAMEEPEVGVPSAAGPGEGAFLTAKSGRLAQLLDTWAEARPGDYLAIQAYLAPTTTTTATLQELRRILGAQHGTATTLGYGPRFLHSTGQLHKGGPSTGRFLQIVDDPEGDVPVPETDYTFGKLIRAQALGDYGALIQRNRQVLRVDLQNDVAGGLQRLVDLLS
jgi:transaldolase/glucose-6-phosphate isomerase